MRLEDQPWLLIALGVAGLVLWWLASGFIKGLGSNWAKSAHPWLSRKARSGLRLLKSSLKLVIARRQTRQRSWRDFLSSRHRIPLWVLRATIFRWFEDNPATEWPYVLRICEGHSHDKVKSYARELLWVAKTTEELCQRDRILEDSHVALVHPCAGVYWVLTNVDSGGFGGRKGAAGHCFEVKRGWCPNVSTPDGSCRYCDLSDEDLKKAVDSALAHHECPS